MALLRDLLVSKIRNTAAFDPGVQVRPACILWPDGERQWEPVIPALQEALPELLVLGPYDARARKGPAIWLRCAMDRQADDVTLPGDHTPVVYLPGFGHQDVRALDNRPEPLVPLAELQYRGTVWSQLNGKDWTVTAFLRSLDEGLGLDVAHDAETRRAAQRSVHRLVEEYVSDLSGKRLDTSFFSTLLVGGDSVREVLRWMDNPEEYRASQTEAEWEAFVDTCRTKLTFDPGLAGVLGAAEAPARHEGAWTAVWTRFCEAPALYPGVPLRIRQCTMPTDTARTTVATHGG